MELTPKKIVDQIKQLLPTFAEFEDSEGNLIQGDPIAWLTNKIEEYGEQQREIKQQSKDAFFDKWKDCIPAEISLDGSYDEISGEFIVVNGLEQFKKELNQL